MKKNKTIPANTLEKTIATTSVIGVLGGLFLLSVNVTGNVIGSMTTSASSILGASLIVVGLIGGFFWVQNRRQK